MQCLGKLPPRPDTRTLHLRDYLPDRLPTPPLKIRWDRNVPTWGVGGNDTYGNCVIVTAAHILLSWRASESHDDAPIADSAIIQLSRDMKALRGYEILKRLNYWRQETMWGSRLWAYTQIEHTNPEILRLTIAIFGAADIGIALPLAWKDADRWDIGKGRTYRPGSWGLHSVPLVGYDTEAAYACSWGEIIPITWPALQTYCDEAYALIGPEWITTGAQTPCGIDLEALRADLTAITA